MDCLAVSYPGVEEMEEWLVEELLKLLAEAQEATIDAYKHSGGGGALEDEL